MRYHHDVPDTSLQDVTLVVLAGGAGSRMGRPKALLDVRGTPILDYLLDRLDWPGPTMLVTAPGRENPPGASRFWCEVMDPTPGEGPLRGLHTALEHVTTELLVAIGVDMVAVRSADLAWFADRLGERPANIIGVMARRNGRIEPLPLALRAGAIGRVAQRLSGGEDDRSLQGLSRDDGIEVVDAAALAPGVWLNVNTPDEWERFVCDTDSAGAQKRAADGGIRG